eukprot:gb/GECH01014713.1/.p1 GENE.gb/GECH01014713.1/~~gb/GECH01014713.1/.p1  ORF type:complete len:376 (+),score=83.81 gb/GECH01014713.1/:1-1128(+)
MGQLQKPSRLPRPKKRKKGKDRIVYKVVNYVEKDHHTSEQTQTTTNNKDIMWNDMEAKPFEVTVSPEENDTESIGSIDDSIPRTSSYEMLCSYLTDPSADESSSCCTDYNDSTPSNNICKQKFDEYTIKVLHKARDKLVSDSSDETSSNEFGDYPRFNIEDKHEDITLFNQGSIAEKTGNGLFRSVRLDTSIPNGQWTYFEMRISPVHGNETGFVGLSTKSTLLDQQPGLNSSSICIGANSFVVYDCEWNEIEAQFYDDEPNTIGCLCKIDDTTTHENNVIPVDVLFYVNGEPIVDVESDESHQTPLWFRLLLSKQDGENNKHNDINDSSFCDEIFPTATLMSKNSSVECITENNKLRNPCPTEDVFALDGHQLS